MHPEVRSRHGGWKIAGCIAPILVVATSALAASAPSAAPPPAPTGQSKPAPSQPAPAGQSKQVPSKPAPPEPAQPAAKGSPQDKDPDGKYHADVVREKGKTYWICSFCRRVIRSDNDHAPTCALHATPKTAKDPKEADTGNLSIPGPGSPEFFKASSEQQLSWLNQSRERTERLVSEARSKQAADANENAASLRQTQAESLQKWMAERDQKFALQSGELRQKMADLRNAISANPGIDAESRARNESQIRTYENKQSEIIANRLRDFDYVQQQLNRPAGLVGPNGEMLDNLPYGTSATPSIPAIVAQQRAEESRLQQLKDAGLAVTTSVATRALDAADTTVSMWNRVVDVKTSAEDAGRAAGRLLSTEMPVSSDRARLIGDNATAQVKLNESAIGLLDPAASALMKADTTRTDQLQQSLDSTTETYAAGA